MNIFVLDRDPIRCAVMHCDKHVIKMILESAQMLCAAHHVTGSTAPYKLAHKNHPCTIWVRSSLSNYRWLITMSLELCIEYTRRYGRRHKSQDILEWLQENEPNINDEGLTEWPQCMPDEYKCPDPVQAYHNFYIYDKSRFTKWPENKIPRFFREHFIDFQRFVRKTEKNIKKT